MEKLLPTAANDYSAIEIYQHNNASTTATTSASKPGRQPLYDYDKVGQGSLVLTN